MLLHTKARGDTKVTVPLGKTNTRSFPWPKAFEPATPTLELRIRSIKLSELIECKKNRSSSCPGSKALEIIVQYPASGPGEEQTTHRGGRRSPRWVGVPRSVGKIALRALGIAEMDSPASN